MTSKELLDKYVRACIEIDREEKNYIPWRPLAVSLAEKEHLEREILKRIDEDGWHTGTPTEEGLYVVAFRLARVDSWSKEIHQQLFIFRDGRWMFDANYKILAWQKIEPYKED